MWRASLMRSTSSLPSREPTALKHMDKSRRQWLILQSREVHFHPVHGLASRWDKAAPAKVKCQVADRVAALGAVSGIQEHAHYTDAPGFGTSLQGPLFAYEGSVGGTAHM